MLRGMYTAASGMLTQQRVQDMRSNNIANTDTTGFKRDMPVESSFSSMLISRINDQQDMGPGGPEIDSRPTIGDLGTGAMLEETVKDFSQGSLQETGNSLDLALEGDGFFTVEDAEGELAYTRQGAFSLDPDGNLVNLQGNPVMGEQGIIQVSGDGDVTVDSSGAVFEDGQFVDTLALAGFENPQGLSRQGENLLQETEESGEPQLAQEVNEGNLEVQQGFLEGSNVSTVEEMTGMINALRAYEANQKSIQSHDDTLDQAVNQVGGPPR